MTLYVFSAWRPRADTRFLTRFEAKHRIRGQPWMYAAKGMRSWVLDTGLLTIIGCSKKG